ncbi:MULTISPECIES: universal stress protein [unclassified Brevibacterium]|uniref:universal stress protein n=1 Tax=unclassified Brevibacterium TaxID=2614124 RepID=UPI001E38C679|nr:MULTISPECIES: universal stress protein [unclassified Brevibacterium]MCD1285339.1 universal stress protein [Brevibacterium sp. CCUG 69071]MDK8434387.1 universal stress protein [Brevibacterium sp. H-BE7]
MTIVIGYVNTPAGHAALDSGIDQAKKDSHDLVVVNASRSASRSDSYRLGEGELKSVKDYLGRSGVEYRVLTPGSEYDPAEQLLDAAAEVGAELIVLGTRKRTPVGKFLLGSTIQRVILDAECPVLCVKAKH